MAKILIIDDDHLVGHSYKRVLMTRSHEVDVESNSGIGLNMALSGDYDVIITDLVMPGVSGAEVIKQLRDHRPEMPVIAISGVAELSIMGAFGVDVLLQKPVRADQLCRAVLDQIEGRVNMTAS